MGCADCLCTLVCSWPLDKFYVVSPAVPNGAGDHRAARTPPWRGAVRWTTWGPLGPIKVIEPSEWTSPQRSHKTPS